MTRNTVETEKWATYKSEHVELNKNLKEYQKKFEVDVMVPIGGKALMPGKLYHTNEILISHYQGVFSNLSTDKAIEISNHRIKLADTHLKALEVEKDMYTDKLDLPFAQNAFSRNGEREIIEDYNEEEEIKWRVEHKKKLREYKKEEAKKRNLNVDTDLFDKLDELEMMEELHNELENIPTQEDDKINEMLSGEIEIHESKKRLSHYAEKDENQNENVSTKFTVTKIDESYETDLNENELDIDDDLPIEYIELLKETEKLTLFDKRNIFKRKLKELKKKVKKTILVTEEDVEKRLHDQDLLDIYEDEVLSIEAQMEEDTETDDDDAKEIQDKNKELQPTIDEKVDEDEVKNVKDERRIKFSSSNDIKEFDLNSPVVPVKAPILKNNDSTNLTLELKFKHSDSNFKLNGNTDDEIITSPADIYKKFSHCLNNSSNNALKSILKNKEAVNFENRSKEEEESFDEDFIEGDGFKLSSILGEIVEKKSPNFVTKPVIIPADEKPKKISRFKVARQKN